MESFLQPFIDEMNQMSQRGLKIIKNGQAVYAGKVHLLGITGDIPGIAKLINHSGHMSEYGCRICKTTGVAPAMGGRGKYFRFVGPLRTKDELMSNVEVSNHRTIYNAKLTYTYIF